MMHKSCCLLLLVAVLAGGCGLEFVRTTAYSRTWCGLEVRALELKSERFPTSIKLIPMFHIADMQFYEAVKKEADKADIVFVEGLHGLDEETREKERKRLAELLRSYWLAPQITALELGNNARIVDLDVEIVRENAGAGGLLMPSLENLLKRYRDDLSGKEKSWNPNRPNWEQMGTTVEVGREPRRLLAHTAIKAIENLADEPDYIARRNRALVDEVERTVSAAGGSVPGKLLILYGAAHIPGILKLLKKKMGYEPVDEPVWKNVWVYRQRMKGELLPYRSNLKIELNRDALLVRHRRELWQCFFSESLSGGLNVIALYFQFRDGEWRRRQVTGFPDESGKVPEKEPVTFEAPNIFLHESGAKFTPVILQSVDTTRMLFHARRSGNEIQIYLDPARLPGGEWLSAEYAVYPGGGRLPVPDTEKFSIGPEYRFSRKP